MIISHFVLFITGLFLPFSTFSHSGSVGVEIAWSRYGYSMVATDPFEKRIYVGNGDGEFLILSAEGLEIGKFQVAEFYSGLRTAKLNLDKPRALVGFSLLPNGSLCAFDSVGKVLWNIPNAGGIWGITPYDLHGDGLDELIVGTQAGLVVLDHQGKTLWKGKEVCPLPSASVGDFNGDQVPDIIANCNWSNSVQVYDFQGKHIKDIDAGFAVHVSSIVKLGSGSVVVISGKKNEENFLAALDFDGKKIWEVSGIGGFMRNLTVASSKPWIGFHSAILGIVDAKMGMKLVPELVLGDSFPEMAWYESLNAAPLFLAAGRPLVAYRIIETRDYLTR